MQTVVDVRHQKRQRKPPDEMRQHENGDASKDRPAVGRHLQQVELAHSSDEPNREASDEHRDDDETEVASAERTSSRMSAPAVPRVRHVPRLGADGVENLLKQLLQKPEAEHDHKTFPEVAPRNSHMIVSDQRHHSEPDHDEQQTIDDKFK